MKTSMLKMTMPLVAAICTTATSVLADALPSSLTHRWSFNSDENDQITGAAPVNRWTPSKISLSDGQVHFRGNSWGGGSLHLGNGSLGSGDATVEIWATQDAIRNNSVIFSYSNNGWGTSPTMDACMQWTVGTDINKDALWLKSDNVDRINKGNTMAPYELGKEYHIAMTFHDNGDGSTTVYWQKRDAATGMLEKQDRAVVANWTLSAVTASTATFAIGVWKQRNVARDACASYNEVRVWNEALSPAQLAFNAKNGPDTIELLPSGLSRLAHRWSFNADDFPAGSGNLAYSDVAGGVLPQSRWGTTANNSTTPLELESGKLKLVSNGWGGGSLDLGAKLIDGDDATIEVWARYDTLRYSGVMFEYGNPNNAYNQTGSQVTDAITYYWNNGNTANDYMIIRHGGTRVLDVPSTMSATVGTMYHWSFSFKKSGSDTVVKWARRNATTGEVEATGSQTVANWTLSDVEATNPSLSLGIAKNQNYLGSYSRDANATYDEVRIWKGALSDDQLTANVFMGPDVAAPSTVVVTTICATVPSASIRKTK